jgi:D-alanyl-D-alanine dipeptidase
MTAKWDRSKGRPEPIAALNKILEHENGELLVDVREYAPTLRIARPAVIPYVRKTVAEMVEAAAQKMPAGVHMGLVEGWRPIERQQRIYDWWWANIEEAFPDWSFAQKRRFACRFVAPTNQKAPPGHCTGAAVDIWLIDEAGEQIDVWSPHERFQAAPTYVYGLSDQALAYRSALVEAMLEVGFSNCRDEWWHYSYGDAGWAVRTGATSCPYGLARLPIEIYGELERAHAISMVERDNPLLKK